MVTQCHAEAPRGLSSLRGERGVGHDVGGGGLVECLGGVGLLDGVITDGVGVELALDHGGAGGGFGEEISPVVAGAADVDGGDVRGGEEIGDELLVVRAGSDRGEVVGGFEGAAFGAAVLRTRLRALRAAFGGVPSEASFYGAFRLMGGAEAGGGFGAAARQFCRVLGGGCRELPRLLGSAIAILSHYDNLSLRRGTESAPYRRGVSSVGDGCVFNP